MDSVDSRTRKLFARMLEITLRVLGDDLPPTEERRYETPAGPSYGKVNGRGYVTGPRSEKYRYKRGE